ncbi:MAG: TIGR03960 family B12-binding radical SAM protein [Armatimonadetes bacterium]|nr:TIGR03960 family B12-binding radical SAM protein [Armatimonadota bacterium]
MPSMDSSLKGPAPPSSFEVNSARNYEHLLASVQKPSRYLGCEVNSVHKDPSEVDVRIALAFPDMYDLGLGNLGILILYSILNRQPGVWAERVYAPAPDLEERLRARALPLFAVESKTPLNQFDCVGFTLQYELTYTNILNMLDLGGIPLRADNREDGHPIVIAGGPCVFNPEPLADFIDGFVIGDGEDIVLDLVAALRESRGLPRDQQLRRLAAIDGMYVPALYDMVALPDGTLVPPAEAQKIRKRLVKDLNAAPYPSDYIVPFTEQVHDRVSLEVLRGCTQGCRFCQAGMVTRPVRERNLDVLQRLEAETLCSTGYEEVALSSLSTCDYSKVKVLMEQSARVASEWKASVSLPSLRLDSYSIDLSEMAHTGRKTGLTFAPEAATDRMRALINKFIPEEELVETTREVFSRGWDVVKLYFMIGLPLEEDEDVFAIADLARKVLKNAKAVNRRARVNLGVSTFVPKPHTPFQWDRQINLEETHHKQNLLRRHLKVFGMKFGRHDALASYLEGVISRGDRSVGALLQEAYSLGCRFDGWGEHLRWDKWEEAFQRCGTNPEHELRERRIEDPLPWDHIDILVEKGWLVEDYKRSRDMFHASDCRQEKCHQCGVIDTVKPLCLDMLKRSHEGRKEEATWQRPSQTQPPEHSELWCLRFRFARRGMMRFLSHLETVNMFVRAIRRARIPVFYTQGFHSRPKLAFGTPLPTGMESESEWADVSLRKPMDPQEFILAMNGVLPEGFEILEADQISIGEDSLMGQVSGGIFEVDLPDNGIHESVDEFLRLTEVWVDRRKKDGSQQTLNLRPLVADLAANEGVTSEDPPATTLRITLKDREGVRGKPSEVLRAAFHLDEGQLSQVRIRKVETLFGERTRPSQQRTQETE